MGTDAYVVFLVLGVLLVVIDGQLIYRGGRKYMESSDAGSGDSMVTLVSVLFHLAALGIVALLSVVNLGTNTTMTAVVSRLGIELLVLAIAHGVAMTVISRVRDAEITHGPDPHETAEGTFVNPTGDAGRERPAREPGERKAPRHPPAG